MTFINDLVVLNINCAPTFFGELPISKKISKNPLKSPDLVWVPVVPAKLKILGNTLARSWNDCEKQYFRRSKGSICNPDFLETPSNLWRYLLVILFLSSCCSREKKKPVQGHNRFLTDRRVLTTPSLFQMYGLAWPSRCLPFNYDDN